MDNNSGNNSPEPGSKRKGLKAIAIILSLIEAVAVAVFAGVIGFDGFVRYQRMATPLPFSYDYDGEAVFDFDIKGDDGVEYPAGTVLKVYGFTPRDQLMLKSESGTEVTGAHSHICISDAKNGDELYQAYEALQEPERINNHRQDVTVIVVSSVVCLIACFIFAYINNSWIGEPKKQLTLLAVILVLSAANSMFLHTYLSKAHAPVIYLYPEQDTEVNVRLTLNGKLTTTYPLYDEQLGWNVTASPDGILTDKIGRQYSYLFWEGDIAINPDLSRGFCVKGEDTAGFLEKSLKQLGLSDTEADAFIMYWLPLMEGNKYNVITFQTTAYEDVASLSIAPKPDTVIRVNMLWYPANTYVDIEPQDLTKVNPSERIGFTVVEWGGEKYRKPVFQK